MSGIFGAAADVDYEAEMSMNDRRWQPTISERSWQPTISEEASSQQWGLVAPSPSAMPPAASVPAPLAPAPAPVLPTGPSMVSPQAAPAKSATAYDQVIPFVKGGVAMAAIAHGYKRNNDSILWGLAWGAMGYSLWWLAAPLMVAQGFTKPAAK